MDQIIKQSLSFIFMILMGYVLKKVHLLQHSEMKCISRIIIYCTLPATIIVSFSAKKLEAEFIALIVLGLLGGIVYLILGYSLSHKASRRQKAFDMLNLAGYNIGNFTLPFIQTFVGKTGIVAAGMFDIGNSMITLGTSLAAAKSVKNKESFSASKLMHSLCTSVPFLCYVVMTLISGLGWRMPDLILNAAQMAANANVFLAMLMIGIGLNLTWKKEQTRIIVKLLTVRYGAAALFSVISYSLLPFTREIKTALILLYFSPFASIIPAYTAELKEDAGLSSTLNSASIAFSMFAFAVLTLVVI